MAKHQAAFESLRECLVCAPILSYPNNQDTFILDTDASDIAIGAELLQVQNGEEKCYLVYVHCFNGSIQEHQMWLSHFPNAHFGISPLVLDSSNRHPELIGIIRKMDVVWLLLESDAPYFRDPDSHQLGTSHLVCQIAELISQVCLVPTSTVLKEACWATRCFYKI